jgi:pyroglutamyl-peptidase
MSKPARSSRPAPRPILLTGFEAFAGATVNPTESIVAALNGRVIAGRRVIGVILPCVFRRSTTVLLRQLRVERPDVVICLGLAGGRAEITPERIAINVDDARIADNAGGQPVDRPVVRGGPAAYWSTLPIKAMVAELRAHGLPASVSQSAGTFVCNHVFFGLMHALRRRPAVRAGFVHVPFLPEQAAAGQASLPLATQIDAVVRVIEVAARRRRDRRIGGGATH